MIYPRVEQIVDSVQLNYQIQCIVSDAHKMTPSTVKLITYHRRIDSTRIECCTSIS